MKTLTYGTTKFIKVDRSQQALINLIYPIGSIFTSGTDTSLPPGQKEGIATWVEIAQDRVLQGTENSAGEMIKAGLPNIVGDFGGYGNRTGFDSTEGAFYSMETQDILPSMGEKIEGLQSIYKMGFNASKSSPIYGASNTVQPPAYKVHFWLRTE